VHSRLRFEQRQLGVVGAVRKLNEKSSRKKELIFKKILVNFLEKF
jgi:hypothetical protein